MTYTATYSPEDNKIRLSASSRLDAETYARVKAAGFGWAPKQGIFVAPMWTPEREDLALELAGEIEDEDKSLVERAEERAERFEDYSDKRATDANQAREHVARIADGIPFGQPILIGHHSEKHARRDAEKIENGMRRAVKMWETAKYWEQRAAGALRHAKYKELPAVRVRRIKTIEADRRREIASFTPDPKMGTVLQHRWNAPEGAEREPHAWCGQARGGHWVPVSNLEHIKARASRWIQHCDNRLIYEKAMLAESGESHRLDKQPRPKQLPLCNYKAPNGLDIPNMYRRGEMLHYPQVEMTQAEYARINVDYKGTRPVGNSHRVRTAMQRSSLICVFLTDSKVHEVPEDVEASPRAVRPVPTYMPTVKTEPNEFDAMRESLRAGVQIVSAPQLFPTPADLAARMVELADLQPGETVLEPSAGTGSIVRAVIDSVDTEIVGYEINSALVSTLDRTFPSYKLQTRCRDFLEVTEGQGQFPVVLMNPPFADGADIAHIKHALSFLKPGGRLVAICANGPRQNEKLRPIVEQHGGTWEELPADTFKEQGTSVRTVLLSLTA